MVPTDKAAHIMHEARIHDAVPARNCETKIIRFRIVSLHIHKEVYL